MSNSYKAKNKRIIHRDKKGKFRKTNLSDICPGVIANQMPFVCKNCGHEWTPLIETDHCQKCKSNNIVIKQIEISDRKKALFNEYKTLVDVPFIDPFKMHKIESLKRELGDFTIEYLRRNPDQQLTINNGQ